MPQCFWFGSWLWYIADVFFGCQRAKPLSSQDPRRSRWSHGPKSVGHSQMEHAFIRWLGWGLTERTGSVWTAMNNPNLEEGRNPRAVTTGKRKILRTIRLFFLQGWAWYRGNYIGSIGRLAAFFAWPDISSIQQQLTSKRTWWFERDRHFHLRRQDGAIHLQKPPSQFKTAKPPTCSKVQSLKLLTYNCQSLGRGSSRLQELVEDMSNVNVTVAALQGTRWQSDNPRSEWVVKGRFGKPLFFAFSWGRPNNNTMLGVQLLISCSLMQHAHVHTRFDPPKGLAGRLGGVRVLSRTPGCELDELFVVAYAPQEGDAVSHAVFSKLCWRLCMGFPNVLACGCLVISMPMSVLTWTVCQLACTGVTLWQTIMGQRLSMHVKHLALLLPTHSAGVAALGGHLMVKLVIALISLLYHRSFVAGYAVVTWIKSWVEGGKCRLSEITGLLRSLPCCLLHGFYFIGKLIRCVGINMPCKLRLMTCRLAMLFWLIAKQLLVMNQRWIMTIWAETLLKPTGLECKLDCMKLLAIILPWGPVKRRLSFYPPPLTCSCKSVLLSRTG